jgi:hypothetical protein
MSLTRIQPIVSELPSDNYLINGNFDFWQRGTSKSYSSTSTQYDLADRWLMRTTGVANVTASRQAFIIGQTDVPNNPKYFYRWDITSYTSGNGALQQRIEGVNTLADKKATVSLWLKSDVADTVGVYLSQYFGSGGSPSSQVNLTLQNINVGTTWAKHELTFDLPSISGKTLGTGNDDYLCLNIQLPDAARTIDIAQVKLEEGSVATPFVTRQPAEELALCQRYYQTGKFGWCGIVFTSNGDSRGSFVAFNTMMRTSPSVTLTMALNTIFAQNAAGGGAVNTFQPSVWAAHTYLHGFNVSNVQTSPSLPSTGGMCTVSWRDNVFAADAEL